MTTHHPQPDSSEQDARMRREHAAMLEFIRSLEMIMEIYADGDGAQDVANAALKLAVKARTVTAAIDTPAAANADNGLPAGGISTVTSVHGTTMYIVNGYNFNTEHAAKEYRASLNAATGSAAADTVAGSGNAGGEA